jgi:hypothetical protein
MQVAGLANVSSVCQTREIRRVLSSCDEAFKDRGPEVASGTGYVLVAPGLGKSHRTYDNCLNKFGGCVEK